ncbi:MAG TPA: hypothetical protein VMP86_01095 [Candidatus Binatia bacterium]|nr:hypothetical protein [Candidatus Binatia bacterium]
MKRQRVCMVVWVTLLTLGSACAAEAGPDATPDAFAAVSADEARPLPPGEPFVEGRMGPAGGTIFAPTSARLEHGSAYAFNLGHCGLGSPVDADGGFWDAVDGIGPAGGRLDLERDDEMINPTSGVIVVIGDEARFRTETGSLIRFERHAGEKEFPGCA